MFGLNKIQFNKLPQFAQSILTDLIPDLCLFDSLHLSNIIVEEDYLSFNFKHGKIFNHIKINLTTQSFYDVHFKFLQDQLLIEELKLEGIDRNELNGLFIEQLTLQKISNFKTK